MVDIVEATTQSFLSPVIYIETPACLIIGPLPDICMLIDLHDVWGKDYLAKDFSR